MRTLGIGNLHNPKQPLFSTDLNTSYGKMAIFCIFTSVSYIQVGHHNCLLLCCWADVLFCKLHLLKYYGMGYIIDGTGDRQDTYIDISTKPMLLCSPSPPPSNKPHSISLAPLLVKLPYWLWYLYFSRPALPAVQASWRINNTMVYRRLL